MMAGTSADDEIVQVHAARSPSPEHGDSLNPTTSMQNGHDTPTSENKRQSENSSKTRDAWIKSDHESLDTELPIQDQIKQDILGFVAKEMKKSDKNPSFVFYSHDPNGLDEKFMKSLSRPSSGHKEKRSPSYRRRKRHSSKHRESDNDFEAAGSSFSALEKVDDYLKEYKKEEEVTLSGDLEIEVNGENNNIIKDHKHKSRKTRRKASKEHKSNDRDVSPKVFQTANKHGVAKDVTSKSPARPTDLTTILNSLESGTSCHNQYIDNPFSSPSPLTSPNDRDVPCKSSKPHKIYVQGGGTFRPISSDRTLASQKSEDEDKYFRSSEQTLLDVALFAQKLWQLLSPACNGILAGLCLMHVILVKYSDDLDTPQLIFQSQITAPYVAAYYFLCAVCLVSALDRLNIPSMKWRDGLNSFTHPIILVVLYSVCLLTLSVASTYDERVVLQMNQHAFNRTGNDTVVTLPQFYHTWTRISIWRSVIPIITLIYFVLTNPEDLVYANLNDLLQFKHSLQSIG